MTIDERVIVFDLDDSAKGRSFSRKEFYDSQIDIFERRGKPSLAVEVVDIFIFNEHGELFVQMRSRGKRHNPNLLDKSIGGHIKYGDTPDYTVMVETVQELKVPSIVLRTEKDFKKTLALLKGYLDTVAIIRHVDTKLMKLMKVIDDKEIGIANKVNLYFGLYTGGVKAVDREAKGVLTYSISDLKNEIKKSPEIFTNDLCVLLKTYDKEIEKFIKEEIVQNN